jgi:hypothetical protein
MLNTLSRRGSVSTSDPFLTAPWLHCRSTAHCAGTFELYPSTMSQCHAVVDAIGRLAEHVGAQVRTSGRAGP